MRSFFTALFVFLFSLLAAADKPAEWLPVTQQEKDIKDVPGYSGSLAVQLYYDYYKDENDRFENVYHRIKILRPAGMAPGTGYADAEILLEPGVSLQSLAARTIQPDGTIVEFTGKPFDKTVFKHQGVKFAVKTFSFPAVTVGSILEYRYVLNLPIHVVSPVSAWPIQGPLFTVKAHFRFRAFQGLVLVPSELGNSSHHSRVSYAYLNQVDATIPTQKAGNLMEMELTNIPPFLPEDYMPPEQDYKPTLLFYYGGRETAGAELFWQDFNKRFAEWMENNFGDRRLIHEVVQQVVGSETDPEQKLRRLYARMQQIRNPDFERPRSEQELKNEGLKTSYDASDALKRGYGTQGQITRLLLAMARDIGLDAHLLWVSGRQERSFVKNLLLLDQMDGELLLANVNGKDIVLDPGTVYCPFGYVRWMHTNTPALKIDKGKAAEFMITPAPPMSFNRRTAKVTLAADGSLKGEITIDLTGEDALQHRIEGALTDDAGRRKALEDEIKALLPAGAIVTLLESHGWTSFDTSVMARFSVEIPNYAAVTGKRLLAPALLFSTLQKNMFKGEFRRYPVIFSYPFTEVDEVTMKLPEGYTLDAPPYRRKSTLAYAGYETSSSVQDNQLITKRSLHVDEISLPPEKYYELKSFFTVVVAGDGGSAVLQKAQPAAQQ